MPRASIAKRLPEVSKVGKLGRGEAPATNALGARRVADRFWFAITAAFRFIPRVERDGSERSGQLGVVEETSHKHLIFLAWGNSGLQSRQVFSVCGITLISWLDEDALFRP